MEDAFFSQLDGNAVRELLLRTELRHAALFAVSDTLRIERCSDAAQQLSGLHPMEELDPFLSGSTRNILLRCINTQSACTAEEDIDGTVYTVEMIPHRGGALLAYLRRDRAAYDGSLRVIQDKSSRYLGALMAEAEQVEDPALAVYAAVPAADALGFTARPAADRAAFSAALRPVSALPRRCAAGGDACACGQCKIHRTGAGACRRAH